MRILIINHYAGSLQYGMEYRPYYFAREWIKMGHTVDIIAADFSHLRTKNPIINKDFEIEQIDGITYHWIKTGEYTGSGSKRAITMALFVSKLYLNAKKIAEELKPDIVISSSTYPLDTYPAKRISKFSGAKLVHEIHDMWPLTLIEIGSMSRRHPFVVSMQIAENSFCKNSDKIISLLPNAKEYLMDHGMKSNAFHYIPNGVVEEDWEGSIEIPKEHDDTLSDLIAKGKFIVGYFGGHAISNSLDVLLEVAKEIKTQEIHFVLVGKGMEKQNLEEWVLRNGITNVTFLPPVAKLSIPNLLKHFDCIYIGGKSHPLYRFGTAVNKLCDSMMSGKPIIYALASPNNDVIDFKCGISVEPGNINSIINAINTIYQMDVKSREVMGERGQEGVLRNYEYKILAKRYADILKN